MKPSIYEPHNYLADFIKYYWVIEQTLNTPASALNRVIPSGELQIMFHYGAPFREVSQTKQGVLQPQCLICGQQTGYMDIVPSGSVGMIAAVFYPYTFRAFFPDPVNEFTNQSVALDNFFRHETRELQERIIEAPNTPERIRLIEGFLLRRLSLPYHFDITRAAINTIAEAQGQITIDETAKQLHISRRQFERLFLTNVGMPPKQFGRIIRLHNTINLFRTDGSLTELSQEGGYFDQSHLIREFKEFTGLSPKAFFRHPC